MGNWHCVPSGCAEVVYKEYLPPSVRWKYPGEAWQEIVGATDYTTEIIPDLSLNTAYRFYRKTIPTANLSTGTWGAETANVSSFNTNGINNWYLRALWRRTNYYRYPPEAKFFTGESTPYVNLSIDDRQASYFLCYTNNLGQLIEQFIGTSTGIWITRIEALDPNKRKNNCIFKVFKNGNIVHEEIRSICPEVQKLPCRLSEQVKTIKIKKLPYLERVEVIDWDYETVIGNVPLPVISVKRAEIPHHCLNVYKKNITSLIPPPGITIPSESLNAHEGYITQICSSPDCPPPEYGVVCNDECIECSNCPPGTHPITCGDTVCCYDSNGKSVLEIPQSDYCGGDNCCG